MQQLQFQPRGLTMRNYLTTATRLILTSIGAAALLAPLPTQAEDNSVKRRLDSIGQKYEVDKDGDFKVVFSFPEEKRTQMVFVTGAAYDVVGGMQVRNIFSAVAKVKEDAIANKAADLLKANNGYKIGAYEIAGEYAWFSMKVPDNATAKQLLEAIQTVASVADDKEKELSGARDTF
ncbi:MAG: hypothetical protein QFC78_06590 [Pseudomonadota bacterium]|nr:hypothetical protein [Pseudomonadota bacterium]